VSPARRRRWSALGKCPRPIMHRCRRRRKRSGKPGVGGDELQVGHHRAVLVGPPALPQVRPLNGRRNGAVVNTDAATPLHLWMVTAGLSVIAALLGYVGLTYYLNERPEYAGAEPFDRVYYTLQLFILSPTPLGGPPYGPMLSIAMVRQVHNALTEPWNKGVVARNRVGCTERPRSHVFSAELFTGVPCGISRRLR